MLLNALAESVGASTYQIIRSIDRRHGIRSPDQLLPILENPDSVREILRDFPSESGWNLYRVRVEIAQEKRVNVEQIYISPDTGELIIHPPRRKS